MTAIRGTQNSAITFNFPQMAKGVVLVKPENQDSLLQWTQGNPAAHLKSNLDELKIARKRLQYLMKEVEDLLKR